MPARRLRAAAPWRVLDAGLAAHRLRIQRHQQKIKTLEQWINLYKEVDKKPNDVRDIIELAAMEEDETFYQDIRKELDSLISEIEKAEFKNMLSGKDDDKNCILTIHSGAGGTEAQDWADMLLRMYLRWGEQKWLPDEYC